MKVRLRERPGVNRLWRLLVSTKRILCLKVSEGSLGRECSGHGEVTPMLAAAQRGSARGRALCLQLDLCRFLPWASPGILRMREPLWTGNPTPGEWSPSCSLTSWVQGSHAVRGCTSLWRRVGSCVWVASSSHFSNLFLWVRDTSADWGLSPAPPGKPK